MNYIGSKQTLLPFIEQVFRKISDGSERTVCDIFASAGAVGRHFKKSRLQVIANDFQHYAYALDRAYLEINEEPGFVGLRLEYRDEFAKLSALMNNPIDQVLAFVNSLPGGQGFIARHYGPAGNRFYYTKENAEKADAIRQAIEDWLARKVISEDEYFYLLCSLQPRHWLPRLPARRQRADRRDRVRPALPRPALQPPAIRRELSCAGNHRGLR
jgi:adenine-specific DNA-methyltransferase